MTARYVFDFDGVLFDTAREVLEVAYQTARTVPDFPARWRDHATPPPDVAAAFARHRHLVGPPWQYAVLLRCIADHAIPPDLASFLALAEAQKAKLASFTDAYFTTRGRLAAGPRWLELSRPYPAAAAYVERRARGATAILSTRDPRSIAALCKHYLHLELGPDDFVAYDGREKWHGLVELAARAGLAPGRVFFVDDYLPHALPARAHGIAAQLALWGYLGPRDRDDALTAGLPCLQLDDLDRALRAHEETP
ncbi:MAG TPA: HAD family hydrolase [Kofleriaceae bacterium]|nr:HAD family hydrolase [Kofleriaceae bacterium]